MTAEHLLGLENGKSCAWTASGPTTASTCKESKDDAEQVLRPTPSAPWAFRRGGLGYLLYAGWCRGGSPPYYIKTAFQPRFEREDALRLAGELGVEVTVLELDALPTRGWRQPGGSAVLLQSRTCSALKARAADRYAVTAGRHQRLR